MSFVRLRVQVVGDARAALRLAAFGEKEIRGGMMNVKEIAEKIANELNAKGKLRANIIELATPIIADALEAENAELKSRADKLAEALREMMPYISMLKSYCERGETINFDNDSDEATGVLLTELLNREPLREWEQTK